VLPLVYTYAHTCSFTLVLAPIHTPITYSYEPQGSFAQQAHQHMQHQQGKIKKIKKVLIKSQYQHMQHQQIRNIKYKKVFYTVTRQKFSQVRPTVTF
jgi:negative regulator of replication initiation